MHHIKRAAISTAAALGFVGAFAHEQQQELRLSAPFISGSSVYSPAALANVYAEDIGKPLSTATLERIAERIRARYRTDGYVVPLVVVPASELKSSNPRIHVLEARIAEIALRGYAGPYHDAITEIVAPLQLAGPLSKESMRKALRRIEALPGIKLDASFAPSASDPNRYTLVLNLSYKAVAGSLSAHNRGTKALGREMFGGQLRLSGVFGAEESLTFTASASEDVDRYNFLLARIARTFGAAHGSLHFASSRATFEGDRRYSSERFGTQWQATVMDSGIWRLSPLVGIQARSSDERDSHEILRRSADTRTVEMGVAGERAAGRALTNWRAVYVRGLDILGAESSAIVGDRIDLTFKAATLSARHLHALAPGWQIRADVETQWSNANLPAGERFTYGGAQYGRAFEPGTLVADKGAAGSLQLEYFKRWPGAGLSYGKVYAQADYGTGWDNDSDARDSGSSLTVGVSARFKALLGTLELSHPLQMPASSPDSEKLRAYLQMHMLF